MTEEQDARREFGRRVQELRRQRGLSQEKLGELAELDRTFVSSIENGRRNVTLGTIGKLARALGVDPAVLVSDGPTSN
ncbi:MAG TPA: helix-turn-helix transcriptional regulator [Coriobacteriia bacterium]|jgi:transcriptional regulator with XRE-family HTH domain